MRGRALLDRARKGEPLAITDHRVLIGVIIPAAEAWAQHLICQNWPHVRQSITEAEEAMAAGSPMTTSQDLVSRADPVDGGKRQSPAGPGKPAVALDAAIVDGGIAQTQRSKEAIGRLQAAWNPPGPSPQDDVTADPAAVQAVQPVRIGDLSATLIREAGVKRLAFAVTHDRELIGILVPVTQDLVQFLIEQNISQVLSNIDRGEEHLEPGARMTTLDDAIPPPAERR
jgi:antitoxin (DNA-binding transcriptional repressor) of toxin-antitoxin stability system